jgi:hydrophobic/amphiphilic exporter-1 (mainly G- bacteria), HAE1 family
VEHTLIIALILVVLVIFIYLGKLTNTIIPSLALPISVIGTFIFMYLFKFSIDNLSLLALIIAVGFIVDDAIVVLENIVRRVEEGEDPWTASINGSYQIGFTILSMTISLAAVFIPLIFMGGLIGKVFQQFAITLLIITLLSGIISLTLTPMLCSRFIKPRNAEEEKGFFEKLSNSMNDRLLSVYKPALEWILDHRWIALVIGLLSVILSGYYFYALPKDFIPDDDIGFIMGYTQSEQGTSPYRMIDYQKEVTDIIRQDPAIATLISISANAQYRNGIVIVRLKPKQERSPISTVLQRLYVKLLQVPGINTFLKNIPLIDLSIGTQTRGSYQYTLQSIDPTALNLAATEMEEKMRDLPGFQGVSSDLEIRNPQLNLKILRDQASTFNVSAETIETALQLAYGGGRVSRIQTPIDQYDVILEVEPRFQEQPDILSKIYVRADNDMNRMDQSSPLIPLSSVAKWDLGVGAGSINHIAQFPSVTISFNLAPGVPLGVALEEIRQVEKTILPSNVTGEVRGTAQTFEESLQSTTILLIVAVLTIYIVLGILYESFIHPLTILSTLPPATFGGLITLSFFNLPLSLYAYLGIILLIGIVKKNGIMMVDYALENERTRHLSPRDAIFEACLVRFRPIMMTTVTSIVGAIPIAIAFGTGSEARRPLGIVIIGGLLFSQLITLFITPVIYLYLDRFNTKFSMHVPEEGMQAK